tara:strand:+ start:65 stop:223 length:159 start_codon:yes stop_codon:yes gene_type:complete
LAVAVALLSVIFDANSIFTLSQVLKGFLILVMWGIIFYRISNKKYTYPVHWI